MDREPTPEYRTLRGHAGAVSDVEFHPRDGRTLLSAGTDGTVREWDFQAGTELVHRQRTTASRRPQLAYSPDGRRLAVSEGIVWPRTGLGHDDRDGEPSIPGPHRGGYLLGVLPGQSAHRFRGRRFGRAGLGRDDASGEPANQVPELAGRGGVQPGWPAPSRRQFGQHRPRLGLEERTGRPTSNFSTRAASRVWHSAAMVSGWRPRVGIGPSKSGIVRRGSCSTTCPMRPAQFYVWCSAMTVDLPGAVPIARSRFGTDRIRKLTSCEVTQAGSKAWHSAPTASGSPRPAWTGP